MCIMNLLLFISFYIQHYELVNYYNYIIQYWFSHIDIIYLIIPKKFEYITLFYQKYKFTSKKIYINYYDNNDYSSFDYQVVINLKYEFQKYSLTYKDFIICNCPYYSKEIVDDIQLINNPSNEINNNTNINNEKYIIKYFISNEYNYNITKNQNFFYIYYFQDFISIINNKQPIHPNFNSIEKYIDENYIKEVKLNSFINNNILFNVNVQNYYFYKKKFYKINEEFNNQKLLFYSNDDKGIQIIKKEKAYLEFLLKQKIVQSFFTPIFQTYEIGYLLELNEEYKNIKIINDIKYITYNEKLILKIIEYISLINQLGFKKIPKIEFLNNINKFFYEKTNQLYENIDNIIKHFPKFQKVNNIHIDSFEKTLNSLFRKIFDYFIAIDTFEYYFIHGDCIFSNILINQKNNNLLFKNLRIDFNQSTLFIKEMDKAMILFSIYNNEIPLLETFNQKEIIFNIPILPVSQDFISYNFNKIHYIIMIIINFHYAAYNYKNEDICLYYYYYGLYLASLI